MFTEEILIDRWMSGSEVSLLTYRRIKEDMARYVRNFNNAIQNKFIYYHKNVKKCRKLV